MTLFRTAPAMLNCQSVLSMQLAFSATSFGCVCLILIALVSRDAVAQATFKISVPQSPGPMTLQAPRDPSFTVNFETTVGTIFCYLPSRETINTRLAGMAATGQMQQVLTQMGAGGGGSGGSPIRYEIFGVMLTAAEAIANGLGQYLPTTVTSSSALSSAQIDQAFKVFLNQPEISHLFTNRAQTFNQNQLGGGPFTHTLATGCLSMTDAATVLREIRRAMHAHLGLPAPTN